MNLKDPPPAFQKLMAKFWACTFVARRFCGTGTMWIWIRIMCKACRKSCSIVLQIHADTMYDMKIYGFMNRIGMYRRYRVICMDYIGLYGTSIICLSAWMLLKHI